MRSFSQRCVQTLLIFSVVFALVQSVDVSTALANDFAYHWTLNWNYDSTFDGTITIVVGKDDGSGGVVQPAILTQSFAVPCQRVGAVQLSGGHVQFNGGYLQCNFELERMLNVAFHACDQIEPGCQMPIGTTEPYTMVEVGTAILSPVTGVVPIFAHNSTAWSVEIGTSTHTLHTTFAPIGTTSSADWTTAPPINAAYQHKARYSCSVAMDCGIEYSVAGNLQYVDTADAPVAFQTAPTTIYLGRDLAGTVVAAGTMLDDTYVDPGNGLPD